MSKKRLTPEERAREQRKRAIANARDDITRHVARTFVIPPRGPMYVRCRVCRAQVTFAAAKTTTADVVILALAFRLAQHVRTNHKDGDGHE